MKKSILLPAALLLLAACSDEENPTIPAQPGDEVSFVARLDGKGTRTIYGDSTVNNTYPVYWQNGDEVKVASPQCASGRNTGLYKVHVAEAQNYAESLVRQGNVGIQWGTDEQAKFYSIYPASYHTQNNTTVNNTLTPTADAATAKMTIRSYQLNRFEKDASGVWTGTPFDRAVITNPDAAQLNPDAVMYAQTTANRSDGTVNLRYKPFSTVLRITLAGCEFSGLGGNQTVTIEEVMITAPQGVNLVGEFDVNFNKDATTAPTVSATGGVLQPNVLHIPMMAENQTNYLTIGANESITFNAFVVPQTTAKIDDSWTIEVRTTNGTFRRTLASTLQETNQLVPGKIHKIRLPKIPITSDFKFDKSSWISQSPRNVYLSELSLPGAWYCYDTNYQATADLATQWNAGVRAFHIDCRLTDNSYSGATSQILTCAGTDKGGTAGRGYSSGTPVLEKLKKISDLLDSKKDEYAVVVLTIAEKELTSSWTSHGTVDQAKMLEAFSSIINTNNILNLYDAPVTPNTTVNDVLGKVIVKINTTDAGPYTGTIPSTLMSKASLAPDAVFNSMQSSTMYWGAAAVNPAMTFYYMQGQRTYTSGTGNPQILARQSAIDNIIAESKRIYDASEHNGWFQMGIGGFVKNRDGLFSDSEDYLTVANNLNNYLLTQINDKMTTDPSPVGLVLANFITTNAQGTTQVYGTSLTEAIIKMNRMFRLNRDPDKPEWPGKGQSEIRSASSTHSSGFRKSANGWDAF